MTYYKIAKYTLVNHSVVSVSVLLKERNNFSNKKIYARTEPLRRLIGAKDLDNQLIDGNYTDA